jgi:hypothetical protein
VIASPARAATSRIALGFGCALALIVAAGCGGGQTATSSSHASSSSSPGGTSTTTVSHKTAKPRPTFPPYPVVLGVARRSGATPFVPAVHWQGRVAAWVARTGSGTLLLSFDQRLVRLRLHSGTIDAGSSGWRFGPAIAGSERRRLVAAFNGAFKFAVAAGGFMSDGRTAVPLRDGLASIVTYRDGTTDIGSWHHGVPQAGKPVESVRQNLTLLIDHGRAAANASCDSCWGATLGGVSDPARSAVGVTADGRLIWVGGEHLTVTALTTALLGARVVRAAELDINPEWVAAYLYAHHGRSGAVAALPMTPGQPGVPGYFLAPYSRDFFAIEAR